jgi:RNA polymerase sigma-70 factor, ECF subfamily
VLRDIEELNTEETARALGISPNAVKIRLHRARQALRTVLDQHLRRGSK